MGCSFKVVLCKNISFDELRLKTIEDMDFTAVIHIIYFLSDNKMHNWLT